jgi:uncharacterized protein YkwD
MTWRRFALTALLAVLGACAARAQLSPSLIRAVLDAHASERQSVVPPAALPMPSLVWNERLATVAQAHADRCVRAHNAKGSEEYAAQGGSGEIGENIAWGAASGFGPVELVKIWVAEKADWTYAPIAPSLRSSHYTQMIWAKSTTIGCGMAVCGSDHLLVCNYAPAGNVLGQVPYGVDVDRPRIDR